MKLFNKIYTKLFMQIWILVLSALVFTFGILMLTDMKNFKCEIYDYTCDMRRENDEYGKEYSYANINYKVELVYRTKFGLQMKDVYKKYHLKSVETYIDVYDEVGSGQCEDIETISDIEYDEIKKTFHCERYYDLEKYSYIHFWPRIGKFQVTFPAWRYYVPILLFIISIPVIILSVLSIIEIIKINRESETPIDKP